MAEEFKDDNRMAFTYFPWEKANEAWSWLVFLFIFSIAMLQQFVTFDFSLDYRFTAMSTSRLEGCEDNVCTRQENEFTFVSC